MERKDDREITISTITYPRDSIASKTGILARGRIRAGVGSRTGPATL